MSHCVREVVNLFDTAQRIDVSYFSNSTTLSFTRVLRNALRAILVMAVGLRCFLFSVEHAERTEHITSWEELFISNLYSHECVDKDGKVIFVFGYQKKSKNST